MYIAAIVVNVIVDAAYVTNAASAANPLVDVPDIVAMIVENN